MQADKMHAPAHFELLHPSFDSADALRFVFSHLSPPEIRRARQVSRCWKECADDAVLWRAHTTQLRSQENSPPPTILCNEMWGTAGVADNLGMSAVFSNFQTYGQTRKVVLASSTITDLSFLAELPHLSVLSLSDCQRLVDIRGLRHCTALQHLTLVQGFVETPTQQRSLSAAFPREKVLWDAVERMQGLEELHLGVQEGGGGECNWITTVETVAKLPELRLLSLKGCAKVKSLAPIIRCPKLQVVDLRGVGYASRDLWTLKESGSLVRALLGQEEYDEDPREDAPPELQSKLVLVSAGALGHLGDAVEMTGGFAALKSVGSWGVSNLMCY